MPAPPSQNRALLSGEPTICPIRLASRQLVRGSISGWRLPRRRRAPRGL